MSRREEEPGVSRRSLLALAASTAWPGLAAAAAYPERPIHLIVSSSAGSAPDAIARLLADGLSSQLGQSVIVDNRPGASTSLGTNAVAKAAADGYWLGYVTPSLVLNRALHATLPFDAERDLQPVVQVGAQPLALAVNAASPYRSLADLIEAAARRPGELTYGSTGPGSIFHLTAELFAQSAGIRLEHIPYASGPQALTDLVSGRIDCMFNAITVLSAQVRANRLLALAVTGHARSRVLPDVPTLAEQQVDIEVLSWGGLVAPARTPIEIVNTINGAANAALASPALRQALTESGYNVIGGSSTEFRGLLAAELVRWSEVVRRSGLQPP